jgi:hypothetical protein
MLPRFQENSFFPFITFLAGCECFSHSFAYVAHFVVILRDAWIRTQRAAAARRCANNLATHLPISKFTLYLGPS